MDNSKYEPVIPYSNVVDSNSDMISPVIDSSPSTPPTQDPLLNNPQAHINKMPPILGPTLVSDSGCTHTMAGLIQLFDSITYYDAQHRPEVTLGDNFANAPLD